MENSNDRAPAFGVHSVHENPLVEKYGAEKRWVNWKWETKDGKPTKVPYTKLGKKASTINPDTWSTYKEVKARGGYGRGSRFGIVFTPDQTLLGIDIDHCIENGAIRHPKEVIIRELIDKAQTYTEISPSGTGLHIILAVSTPLSLIANRHGDFEAYTNGRYFTTTFISFGEVRPVREVSPEEAVALIKIIGYPWNPKETHDRPQDALSGSAGVQTLDDGALLEKMFSASNGAKIRALYEGDLSSYDGDDSRADLGLLSHLAFWTNRNAAQMESLWLDSPLGNRLKTQERKDYRVRSIAAAIKNCSETYTPPIDKVVAEKREKLTPRLWTIGDILAQDFGEEEWLVESLITKSGLTALSGNPGDFKTWVTIHIALCLSRGLSVFGKFQTIQGGVLIIDEEDHIRLVQGRLKALGVNETDTIYYLSQSGVKVDDKESHKLILEIIKEKDIRLVILDSLIRIHQQDENDAKSMSAVFGHIQKIIAAGTSVLFTHHHRKQYGFANSNPGQNMRGSSDILAAVDSHVTVKKKKDEKDRLIIEQTKSRQAETLAPFEVTVHKTELGPSGFEFAGDYDEKKLKASEVAEAIPLVLADGMKSRLEIQEALREEFGKTSIEDGTKLAEQTGKIERVPKEELTKGERKIYYRLPVASTRAMEDSLFELPVSFSYIEAEKQEDNSNEV